MNTRQPPPFIRGYGRPETVLLPSMLPVVQLLDGARQKGLRWPKLWLQLPDGTPVRINVAGEQSRTPGYLMLTDGKPFGSSLFFGRISPSGALELGRDTTPERREPLLQLLNSLSRDPAGTAAAFGHVTGSCTFCGLPLSDKRSIEVGYGPTCAQKYAMPWSGRRGSSSLKLLES